MFLRSQNRRKNGKQHRYFSVVENRRVAHDKVVQRTVLYLGEINDSQQAAWRKSLEVFDEGGRESRQLSLFPEDRPVAGIIRRHFRCDAGPPCGEGVGGACQ
ncbi:MAG: hypothetical protein WCK05_09220 [Planctomycetota bacterium]